MGMNIASFLAYVGAAAWSVKYPLFFLGSIIEGPILFFVSGILLSTQAVSLVPLCIALLLGDLVGDVAWYYSGRYVAEPAMHKKGKFIGMTPDVLENAKRLFDKSHEKILFISKSTLGFGTSIGTLLILMTAGITRVPMRKFILLNALGECVLLGIFLTAGYLYGGAVNTVAKDLKIAFIIGSAVVFLGAFYGFTRYIRSEEK